MFQQINSSPHLPAFLKNYTSNAFHENAVENASKNDNVGLKPFKNVSIAPCELYPRTLPAASWVASTGPAADSFSVCLNFVSK